MKKNTAVNIIINDAAAVNNGTLAQEKFLGKIAYLSRTVDKNKKSLVLEAQIELVHSRRYEIGVNRRLLFCDSEKGGWKAMALAMVETYRLLEMDKEYTEWKEAVDL